MSSPQEPPSKPPDTDADAKSHFHSHINTLVSLTSHLPLAYLLASPPCLATYTTARTSLPPAILHHVIRTFIHALSYARTHADHPSPFPSSSTTPLSTFLHDPASLAQLYAACILHDLGSVCNRSSQRFEIDGADAACDILATHTHTHAHDGGGSGSDDEPFATEAQRREVWLAIALHATPQVAERMGGLVGLVRAGVARDFAAFAVAHVEEGKEEEEEEREREREREKVEMEAVFPRLGIEKVLGHAVVGQAVERPGKAPRGTWSGALLEAWRREPGFEGVNPAF
ncbi:hypothetical protein EV356DRAFT_534828 [Viridothelium virens]|uniref:HD/PDEase domain-containing protein n=1 Tax=Viridothelium virens TaxID=1048519 RepID=A0A6A6H243_VIRVR|nr:hypothetical protein EV356DRAFT_534828 [Viridothelium virens]